jgi:hypothetical protein
MRQPQTTELHKFRFGKGVCVFLASDASNYIKD